MLAAAVCPARAPGQSELREGDLLFVFGEGQEKAAVALADGVRGAAPMPGLPLEVLAGDEILVFLAPNPGAYDSLAPGAPDWSAGVAYPEGNRIVLPTFVGRGDDVAVATVLRHELAHIALRRYLGRRVPRWFHEGYAQLAMGGWQAHEAWALRFAILAGRVPPLDSLSLDFRREQLSAREAYLLAYSAVELLYRLGGSIGFARLLERWNELGSLDASIRRTYGITLGQFERLWREEIRDRFGWLLLLTQALASWTLFTVLLLGLGYWKRRRDRAKLAALRAREEVGPDDMSWAEIDDVTRET